MSERKRKAEDDSNPREKSPKRDDTSNRDRSDSPQPQPQPLQLSLPPVITAQSRQPGQIYLRITVEAILSIRCTVQLVNNYNNSTTFRPIREIPPANNHFTTTAVSAYTRHLNRIQVQIPPQAVLILHAITYYRSRIEDLALQRYESRHRQQFFLERRALSLEQRINRHLTVESDYTYLVSGSGQQIQGAQLLQSLVASLLNPIQLPHQQQPETSSAAGSHYIGSHRYETLLETLVRGHRIAKQNTLYLNNLANYNREVEQQFSTAYRALAGTEIPEDKQSSRTRR